MNYDWLTYLFRTLYGADAFLPVAFYWYDGRCRCFNWYKEMSYLTHAIRVRRWR